MSFYLNLKYDHKKNIIVWGNKEMAQKILLLFVFVRVCVCVYFVQTCEM